MFFISKTFCCFSPLPPSAGIFFFLFCSFVPLNCFFFSAKRKLYDAWSSKKKKKILTWTERERIQKTEIKRRRKKILIFFPFCYFFPTMYVYMSLKKPNKVCTTTWHHLKYYFFFFLVHFFTGLLTNCCFSFLTSSGLAGLAARPPSKRRGRADFEDPSFVPTMDQDR